MAPLAVILGCEGFTLSADERAFFRDSNPWGLILFGRNCQDPEQVRVLVAEFRETVGRGDAPVLIDQEGGRVQRLRPPHWRLRLAAGHFGTLADTDEGLALEAVRRSACAMALELSGLGITVDCAPCLDVRDAGTHDVIGDRAFGYDPGRVIALGRAQMQGLLDGGVLPVIKHMPGHGRARVDSHKEMPRVDANRSALDAIDFRPFAALRDCPFGMTAHVLFEALDPERPATLSPTIIGQVIRGAIGFQGCLMTDDLSMEALSGNLRMRCEAALAAGCDIGLYGDGTLRGPQLLANMKAVAEGSRPLAGASLARANAALGWLDRPRPLADVVS